jgi:DNA primase
VRDWAAAYAGSPAAEYVRARGIPDDIAAALGWGYVSDNQYLRAHRLFVPYTDPAGQLTGGAGRALDRTTHPKYLTLRNRDGYRKTLVNGAAIAQARAARKPLVIVEGPFDAAACLAGGVPYVAALNGATARPEWFAGIPRVFLGFDADDAGREAVVRFRRTVPVHAAAFDPDALEGCTDVAEFWQTHGRLPAALIAAAASQPDIFQSDSVDDLPAGLREEAETLGAELAADPEEARRFMQELLAREHTLAAEDRRAAWHALHCAVTVWPEPDPLEQPSKYSP